MNPDRRQFLRTTTAGIAVTTAASSFPTQLFAAPVSDAIRPFRVDIPETQLADLRRRIAETRWPDQDYFNEAEKGGHFAAWEQPELFASEVRSAFRSLR